MISANGVEYKNLPEQVQYLTERAAEFAVELNRVSASLEGVTTSVESLQANVDGLQTDVDGLQTDVDGLQTDVADMQTALNNYDSRINAVESTVAGLQTSLTTAQNTANAAIAKADSALSMIAGLHSLTKQEVEFEGDSVTVAGFVEGSLCTLTKLEGDTRKSINLWDEEWELGALDNGNNSQNPNRIRSKNYIPCLPSTTYYFKAPSGLYLSVAYYDTNKNYISSISANNQTRTTLNNCAFMRFYVSGGNITTYNHDICINLSNVAINGNYYPYFDGLKSVSIFGLSTGGGVVITTSEGTTSLVPDLADDTLELRAYDYLDQIISGTSIITSLVRGSGIIDLGTLNWGYQTINNLPTFTAFLPLAKPTSDNAKVSNILTSNYTTVSPNSNYIGGDKVVSLAGVGSNSIWVKDSAYTDTTTFRTAMSGVYLVYELTTPVTTVLATVTYTDVSAFFEAGAAITVNNANTEYGVESTSTIYGYVAE